MGAEPSRKSHKVRNIGIIVVIVIVLLLAVPSFLSSVQQSSSSSSQGASFFPTEHRLNIADGAVVGIRAGEHQTYTFTIPSGATDARVVGEFEAQGGSGNDIIVAIMDDIAYKNWKSGKKVSTYYSTDKLTADRFDVSLPSGTYVLLFDNSFSLLSNKNVAAIVDLIYKR